MNIKIQTASMNRLHFEAVIVDEENPVYVRMMAGTNDHDEMQMVISDLHIVFLAKQFVEYLRLHRPDYAEKVIESYNTQCEREANRQKYAADGEGKPDADQ